MGSALSAASIVDLAIAVTVLEALGLLLYRRLSGRGIATVEWLPNLCSGLMLMLALRASLAGAPWPWIVTPVAVSGVVHLADMSWRWSRAQAARGRA